MNVGVSIIPPKIHTHKNNAIGYPMAFDLYCQLISLAPIYHMLCRLAAAYAHIGDILLFKRNAA